MKAQGNDTHTRTESILTMGSMIVIISGRLYAWMCLNCQLTDESLN
jgi:hypothetical protein